VTVGGLLLDLNNRVKRNTRFYMVLVALAIGVAGGYGAVGFRWLIHRFQEGLWRTPHFNIAHVESMPWWQVIAIPAIGGLLVGVIIRYWATEAKGHGVPEVMEAVALKQGFIRARVVFAKALGSGLTIASGGSVGREGPIVQIGAALGSTAGQVLRVGAGRMRTLVGCGAAAGIAAAFNAPVAGALFAVEIIVGDFGVPQFSPIVISAVAATVVSRHVLGDVPAFEIPDYQLVHAGEFVGYCVLGVLAALLALSFVKLLYFTEDGFDGMKVPVIVKGALGGAAIGALALWSPGILGVGYESMTEALTGRLAVGAIAVLIIAKLLAVSITLGSGGSGGIFAPSLFLGSMLGALVGAGVNALFPGQTAPPGAYALVGMGAMVAAATHAPITAILIIFEMTADYHVILPLMAACIIATLFAQRLSRESIYTVKLSRRGVDIKAGQDVNVLRHIPVTDVLIEDAPRMDATERLRSMLMHMSMSEAPSFYVVDPDGRLKGVISMKEIRPALDESELLGDLVVAEDVADTHFPSVSISDTLDTVLERLQTAFRQELPVLDGERLVGVVRVDDVLGRYRSEVRRREMEADVLGDRAAMAGKPRS
jgi:CIC family chloride channel protein